MKLKQGELLRNNLVIQIPVYKRADLLDEPASNLIYVQPGEHAILLDSSPHGNLLHVLTIHGQGYVYRSDFRV